MENKRQVLGLSNLTRSGLLDSKHSQTQELLEKEEDWTEVEKKIYAAGRCLDISF